MSVCNFYLPTQLQLVDETKNNITHFDRKTKLEEIFMVPINPWMEVAKEMKWKL
jgi:hypothetical protein